MLSFLAFLAGWLAVIYRGPYAEIRDDEGHVFLRGERIAVCERTFRFLTEGPFKNEFIGIEPLVLAVPVPWCAPARDPSSRRCNDRRPPKNRLWG